MDIIVNINREINKMEVITKTYINRECRKRNEGEWRRIQEQENHSY